MFTLQDVNKMEAEFLSLLDYKVTILASDYTRYFFELQDACVAQESLLRERMPLSKEAAQKLEVLSATREAAIVKKSLRRHQSSNDMKVDGKSSGIIHPQATKAVAAPAHA